MVYTPQRGFAQSQYYDQQATALAGMLANASDINLSDAAFVSATGPDGLTAGMAVIAVPATQSNRPGVNYAMVRPPLTESSGEDIAGIVIRNQWMRTNAKGEACFFQNDMCNILRTSRVGGRIWVRLVGSAQAMQNGKVYCVVKNTGSNNNPVGAFSAAHIAGTATPTAGFLQGGTFNYVGSALEGGANGGFDISIDGTLYKVKDLNLSGATTLSEVASAVQAALDAVASGKAVVSINGNALRITSATTGADSAVSYASAPTDSSNPYDVSAYLGLTQAVGARTVSGSAGTANDTVEVPHMRFMGTFPPTPADPANSIALVEVGLL